MATLDTNTVTIITAILGGVGVQLVNGWLAKSKERTSDAQQIRVELRDDLEHCQIERDKARDEADEWRHKYWLETNHHQETKSALAIKLLELDLWKKSCPTPPSGSYGDIT